MHLSVSDYVPDLFTPSKHPSPPLACNLEGSPLTKEQQICQLLEDIHSQYENHSSFLCLQGRVVLLKSTLEKVVRLAGEYFENSATQNQFCQINIRYKMDIRNSPDEIPFVVKNVKEVFDPRDSQQCHALIKEDVDEYPNKTLALELMGISFYVDRDWKIWKCDLDNAFTRTHNNVIHKILNVRTGKFEILKRFPSALACRFGQKAAATLRDRFHTINHLYQTAQPYRKIFLQPPPYAIVDLRIGRGKSTIGLIEEYFPAGDFYKFANSDRYAQVNIFARAKFCLDFANNIQFLNRLDIYHPDIKTENILIKELPMGGFQIFISDYSDSVPLHEWLDLFESILTHPKISIEDANKMESLQYVHTTNCSCKSDAEQIQYLLKWGILDIVRLTGEDLEKRKDLFKIYKKKLVNLVRKHQVFSLGVSFYQMLSGPHLPYPESEELVNLYCGEGLKQLCPNAKKTLIEQMLQLSLRAKPVIEEMADFVMNMLEPDYKDRPSLSTVCKRWKEFSTLLENFSSPKQRAISQYHDSPPQMRRSLPGPTILDILMKQPPSRLKRIGYN